MNAEINIFPDLQKLSRHAAQLFVEQSARAVQEHGRFLVALNGGSTPVILFEYLAKEFRDQVDWDKTHIFWGDERLVPASDPESSYGQARDILLRHIPIADTNVHRVNTDLEPVEASRDYSLILKRFASPPLEWPRFDLVYLGMGEDGHTASLFPSSPIDVTKPVIPVTAQYQDRPARRISLTPFVFNNARMVVFMATGEKKAVTLAEVLSNRYNPELYPAQRIDLKDGKIIWLIDEDAASKLPHRLISKFCEG